VAREARRVRGHFTESLSVSARIDSSTPTRILQDIIVPITQDSVARILEPLIALQVLGAVRMLPAIDLHDESLLVANEIDDVGADRSLPPKFDSIQLSRSQQTPEFLLGVRCDMAHCLCVAQSGPWNWAVV
jgi:hypothetical protein